MNSLNSISLLYDISKMIGSNNASLNLFDRIAMLCLRQMGLDRISFYTSGMKGQAFIEIFSKSKCQERSDASRIYTFRRHPLAPSKHKEVFVSPHSILNICIPMIRKNRLCGWMVVEYSNRNERNDQKDKVFEVIAALMAPGIKYLGHCSKVKDNGHKYYDQLVELLENEKIYRQEGINLQHIAAKLDVSKSYLSQIINKVGRKSFTALINEYRVEDVIGSFRSGAHLKYSLLSIGLDAGFSSKSTFNLAFKNIKGCSPSQYIQKYV